MGCLCCKCMRPALAHIAAQEYALWVAKAVAENLLAIAAEKASIYTYPASVLPILNPLMKALAYMFPDKGIRQVCHHSQKPAHIMSCACCLQIHLPTVEDSKCGHPADAGLSCRPFRRARCCEAQWLSWSRRPGSRRLRVSPHASMLRFC